MNNEDEEMEKKESAENLEEEKKEEMVNIEINTQRHSHDSEFLSKDWELKWKNSLNLPNITQAIKYTDEKARQFLSSHPSTDNHIDADKFVEFLSKYSLKGLLPNL